MAERKLSLKSRVAEAETVSAETTEQAENRVEQEPKAVQTRTTQSPPVAKKSWFYTGTDEVEKQEAIDKESHRRSPFRFSVKEGEDTEIIFVDDLEFAFYEHEIWQLRRGTQFTCLKGIEAKGCPACLHFGDKGPGSRYLIRVCTVIDLRPFTTKDGKEYKWGKKIFAAKGIASEILRKIRKTRGSLAGCRFMVSRAGEKSERVGNLFQFLEEVDLSQFIYKDGAGKIVEPTPLDYAKIYEPQSAEYMANFIRALKTGETYDEGPGRSAEEESADLENVPF